MAGEKSNVIKGCIKGVKGPWLVHRITKDGREVTKLRYPSERERQNNKRRERERRLVTRKIFSGLRAHGNYYLPKHADSNDILKSLCEEAGWNVDKDGNVSRKNLVSQKPSLINTQECQVSLDREYKDENYCKCNEACKVHLECQRKDEDCCKCNEACGVRLNHQYEDDEDYCKCNEACGVRLKRQYDDEYHRKCNESHQVRLDRQYKDDDYCKCNDNRNSTTTEIQSRTSSQMLMQHYDG